MRTHAYMHARMHTHMIPLRMTYKSGSRPTSPRKRCFLCSKKNHTVHAPMRCTMKCRLTNLPSALCLDSLLIHCVSGVADLLGNKVRIVLIPVTCNSCLLPAIILCTLMFYFVRCCPFVICCLLSLQPSNGHIGVKIQFVIEYPFSILRWLSIPPCVSAVKVL